MMPYRCPGSLRRRNRSGRYELSPQCYRRALRRGALQPVGL